MGNTDKLPRRNANFLGTGVQRSHKYGKPYRVQFTRNYKKVNLGTFNSLSEAQRVAEAFIKSETK